MAQRFGIEVSGFLVFKLPARITSTEPSFLDTQRRSSLYQVSNPQLDSTMGCLKVTVFRNVIRFREFFLRDVILLCLWWNTLYFLTRFRKLQCSWSCVSICGICNSRWNPVLKALSECDRLLCMCTLFSWLVDQSKCKSSLSCKFTFNFCTPSNKLTCIIMYVATWFNSLVYSLCVARRFCTSLKNIWSTHMLVGHFRSYFIDASFRLGSFHEKQCRGFTLGAVYLQVI